MPWITPPTAAAAHGPLRPFFPVFQRSFISMPVPVNQARAAAATLGMPGAMLPVSCRTLEGTKALVSFGGKAEDVAPTQPELAAASPDRATCCQHDRGYGGSAGPPAEALVIVHSRGGFLP